jgi:hypothetical protein
LKPRIATGFWIHTYSGGDNQTHDYISPYWGNFASDFPKDSKAEADNKIVIDKLLVNKLTELLINSIYSVTLVAVPKFF